jgi:hypothetical protein
MMTLVQKIHDDIANPRHADPVTQESGRVVAIRDDGAAVVRTAAGDLVARRAVSCLVAAEVDDLVLLARSPREGAFVLAVLRRDRPAGTTTVALDGDVDLRLASGRLRVAAQEGVDLLSAREVNVDAPKLRVNAVEGSVVVQGLSFLGGVVSAELEAVKLLASRVHSVVERVSQQVQRSYRTVTETDQLRAQRIDYTAEKTMSLHGEHALITAEDLVKVDGDQIHLG